MVLKQCSRKTLFAQERIVPGVDDECRCADMLYEANCAALRVVLPRILKPMQRSGITIVELRERFYLGKL